MVNVVCAGDVMGPTLTGLESLLALPTGCGEQNMILFSPNIFVMQYLQKTNSLTENIRAKAVQFLQTGQLSTEVLFHVNFLYQFCC